ncbi:hypothetical protein DL765_009434 [Monosporascus sp. GIB2]|nr:hypothetical protein DL765_009434 [Monosporascus sp. GIB2]
MRMVENRLATDMQLAAMDAAADERDEAYRVHSLLGTAPRRVVHSGTELYVPESPATPGQLPVMGRSLAAVYRVCSRMPSLAALGDEHAADIERAQTICLSERMELAPDPSYIGERHEPLPGVEAEDDDKKWASMRVRLDGVYDVAALFATKYGFLGFCKGGLHSGDEVY